ncbi:MAG: cell division topological specificity factor MinE [Betaproteobacteria bacterium]|nr:cell division topological specificity factor MinE [Betaproteobacteria bacterium]NBY18050.1 cell division topological specificity factor MinE [Betaproteobacteria bacterium]
MCLSGKGSTVSFLDFFTKRKPATANLAKERLQVIIAREGNRSSNPELIQQIKRAVLEAVGKFVQVRPEDIAIEVENQRDLEVLSVSVTLPDGRSIGI